MTHRVALWSAPRCVSTAVERSIMEVENSKVYHEPYSKAHYFGPERLNLRYKDHSIDPTATFKSLTQNLLKEHNGIEVVFVKNLAYYVAEHFADILANGMDKFKHSFLIRDPRLSIPALYQMSVSTQLTGWDYFDPKESGFREIYDLYHFLTKELGEVPIVMDADDLLDNPEGMMQAYCESTGIKFDKKILRWEPGLVANWQDWMGWYETVKRSSGFIKRETNKKKTFDETELEKLPKIVKETIEECMPLYEELYKDRLLP